MGRTGVSTPCCWRWRVENQDPGRLGTASWRLGIYYVSFLDWAGISIHQWLAAGLGGLVPGITKNPSWRERLLYARRTHTHTHGVLTVDHGPTLPHWNQSSHCGNCVWTCLDHQRIFISSALCAAEADRIWGVVWRFLALLEIDLFIYVVIFCPEIRRYGICKASCCIWICWWFVPIGSSAIWGIYSAYSLFKKHPAILLDVGQGNPIE